MLFQTGIPPSKKHRKLTWEAEHIPLGVSVCYNIPGYDKTKCFVSSGDTREIIQQFVEYLVEVSQESYGLLLDQFADVFRQIDERINEVRHKLFLLITLSYALGVPRKRVRESPPAGKITG